MSFNIFLLWILNFNLINGEHHNVPFIDVSYETFRREFKRNFNEEPTNFRLKKALKKFKFLFFASDNYRSGKER